MLRISSISQQSSGAEKAVLFRCGNPLHNGGMIYGSARVSTDGRTVGAALAQFVTHHTGDDVLMIDHVILTVSDFERSIAFYEQALAPLGATEFIDYPGKDGHPDLKGFSKNGSHFFWLKKGKPDPDAVHVGLVAESQEVVDAFYHAAIAAGGREKTAPSPQLHYHADYYATWVLDPDGHDIEVVNKTGRVR